MATIKVMVRYVDRNGVEGNAEVRVDEYRPGRYTATNLALWGCGKEASSVQGAVYLLVQDMASVKSIVIV